MTELSRYQIELRQDLFDYESLRRGLEAYERISGVPAEDALAALVADATPEQRPVSRSFLPTRWHITRGNGFTGPIAG